MANYLTPTEVAARLRISKMTVYRMIHAGELRALRVGAESAKKVSFRIPEDAYDEYVAAHTTGGPEAPEPADP